MHSYSNHNLYFIQSLCVCVCGGGARMLMHTHVCVFVCVHVSFLWVRIVLGSTDFMSVDLSIISCIYSIHIVRKHIRTLNGTVIIYYTEF